MTNFIHSEVEVLPGIVLTIDGNSKISAGNGTYADPKPNAFSLPHISTCPGATEACKATCYVHGAMQLAPHLRAAYARNENAVHQMLLSVRRMLNSAQALAAWITANCPGGFRWHVSGDVFSRRYASWISMVCKCAPTVNFWIYTRSLPLVTALEAPNLTINISADVDNYAEAREVATEHGLRICYMTQTGSLPSDLQPEDVIFPDYALRGRDLFVPMGHGWWQGLNQQQKRSICPADFFGQSEENRCGKCVKCLHKVA